MGIIPYHCLIYLIQPYPLYPHSITSIASFQCNNTQIISMLSFHKHNSLFYPILLQIMPFSLSLYPTVSIYPVLINYSLISQCIQQLTNNLLQTCFFHKTILSSIQFIHCIYIHSLFRSLIPIHSSFIYFDVLSTTITPSCYIDFPSSHCEILFDILNHKIKSVFDLNIDEFCEAL